MSLIVWLKKAESEAISDEIKRTLSLLCRLSRSKIPDEVQAFWQNATEIDISGAPWGKSPLLDLTPLAGLLKIKTVKADNQPALNWQILATLPSLTFLSAKTSEISDIKFLLECKNVSQVHLSDNPISNPEVFGLLVTLTHLSIRKCNMRQADWLKNLLALVELDVSENHLTNIQFAKTLTELKTFQFAKNMVEDLTFLKGLRNIKALNFAGNRIDDLEDITHMRNLVDLNIGDTRVRSLKPLRDLFSLERLGIAGCPLYDDDIDQIKRSISLY